ncbi:hypothetical protein BP6252_01584 [Coleophoma cylindrospora]|uniref:Spo12-like protein n=1 Tax=Coleophoma cylindrospora TaxID=1849047 RepID=A0A3D8STC9_9HELO|nr:hypothetical protein BP6252_01584 [Coleophoma cylindrospora]
MSSINVLSDRDVNASAPQQQQEGVKPTGDIKSMEYHRQVLQSKLDKSEGGTYVSPSDTIMSPCTAKLSAYRSKQVGKTKPKSLFAKTSAKNLAAGGPMFGDNINSEKKLDGQ